MPPVLDASEEKTNGTRLLRLVVDGGTYVLREFLHSIHPPTTLQGVFSNNKGNLEKLHFKDKIITKPQWKSLFPPSCDPPDSSLFDVTLLHLLLREVCNLTAPSTGWHKLPTDSNVSPEANIVRIKCYRNDVCHSVSTSITKVEFENKWKVVSSALVALGLDQKEVDRMKTEPIDHDTERRIEEEVNKWKLEIEPRVESLEDDVLKMKDEMFRIQGSLSDRNTSELANCLPDKVANVFGRSQEIQQVIQPIVTKKVGIVVITGGPGFGKTTVANKVGYELDDISENTVLFCPLRSKATVNDVATSMILTCSKNHFQPPENPQHWLRNWSKQQQQNVTFILDNADEVLESGDRAGFVSLLQDMRMLAKGNVTFVVTSRKLFKHPSLEMEEVRVTPLSTDEAKKVVESKVHESVQVKLSQTEKLVELCGCVPLALCIIGSLLSDYTEDELIRRLEEDPIDVLKDDLSDDNSVEKAIKISFDFLGKSELKALLLLSAFPGSFDSAAANALISVCPEQPQLILRSLKNRSLVEIIAPQRYQVHQLIQAYAKKIDHKKYSEGEKEAFAHFISRLADNANMYWSKDMCKESIELFNKDRHNFEYFLQFYLQGLNCQHHQYVMTNLPTTLVNEFSRKCLYLEMCLLPSLYVILLETWLGLLKSDNNPQQPISRIVELLCLLGHEKRKVGNRDQYKHFLQEAIELHTKNPNEFDQEKVSEAFFRNNYARFLSEERNFDKAEEQFDIGLKVCEDYLPKDYLQKGVTLLYSGREDNRRNQRSKAEKKLDEALSLFQKGLGTHVMTSLLLKDLADFHLFHGEKKLGSPEERQNSIKLYGQALEMMGNLGIKDHKECILLFTNLGICHQLQDEQEEAMKLYQASLNIAERELGENHRWKIYVMVEMAYWYKQNGNMVKAKALKDQAMKMSDALKLPDHQPPNKFLLKKI